MTAAEAEPRAPRAPAWHLGLVLLCAAGCYAGALGNGFAYDDLLIVAQNERVQRLDAEDGGFDQFGGAHLAAPGEGGLVVGVQPADGEGVGELHADHSRLCSAKAQKRPIWANCDDNPPLA